jgi:peptide/nickel transport system substrate-binding protein
MLSGRLGRRVLSRTAVAIALSPVLVAYGAAAQSAAGEAGGTLRVDVGPTQLLSLDANGYNVVLEKNITLLIAEPLVYRDREMNIVPGLATSWSVAEDGVTWTFKLRENVTFHDGTPFNAEAVIANFDRWDDPDLRNSTLVGIVGPALVDYKAIDEHTLQVTADQPRSGFLAMLSGWGVQIVSPAAFEKFGNEDLGTNQVGTGPFRMESMVPGETLVLARNEDYWGGAPQLETIEFRTIAEPFARTAALLAGEVDMAIDVEASQLPQLESEEGIQIVKQVGISEELIDINVTRPPLDDPRVRYALNHAIDMEQIAEVAYGGDLVPFQGPVPPTLFEPDPSIEGFEHDPDRARELLEEAGVSDLRISLNFFPGAGYGRFAELLQAQFAEAGIELELNRLEPALMEEAFLAGNFDLHFNGLSNSSGDPWQFFETMLVSDASNNVGHEGFDEIADQIGAELDQEKLDVLLNEAFKIYFKEAPYIGTHSPVQVYALRENVQGFVGYPTLELRGLVGTTVTDD